jgi:hypothetical protein
MERCVSRSRATQRATTLLSCVSFRRAREAGAAETDEQRPSRDCWNKACNEDNRYLWQNRVREYAADMSGQLEEGWEKEIKAVLGDIYTIEVYEAVR